MGRNGEPAPLVNDLTDFAGRFALQIGQSRADTKQVSFGGRYFGAGNDEEIGDGVAVLGHQPFFGQVSDRVAGVMVGDGKPVEAFFTGGGDIVLRARDAIAREESMGMEVDVEGHRREANLGGAKWKVSVSRNGRW